MVVDRRKTRLQWGHAFSDVEMRGVRYSCIQLQTGFNGATPFQTWKSYRGAPPQENLIPLQWGHAFSDVEISRRGFVPRRTVKVLQWGHAFSDVEIRGRHQEGCRCNWLQWGHAFSDVEIRGLWWPAALYGRGFNGATPFQTWKCCPSRRYNGRRKGFNGATPFQTWKFLVPSQRGYGNGCFNGATPFQTWKSLDACLHLDDEGQLQWGHAFSDVEMPFAPPSSPPVRRLQWGHAFSDVEMEAP